MKESEIRKREVFNKYLELVNEDVKTMFDFETFNEVPCPACHSTAYNKEFDKSGFTYVSCTKCETLFINPRPDIQTLNKFYSHSVSTEFWVEDFFKPVMNVRMEKIFKPRASELVNEFPEYKASKIGDIGAGFGLMLEALKTHWPQANLIAIEPSESMANECRSRGFEVYESMLEDIEESAGNFDLLVSFELFEHLYDPEEFLNQCKKLLNPGGRLIMTTLSGKGFDIQLLWEKSKSISPPHHLNFFNPESVEILANRVGFTVEKISTPGRLDWDIVEGMHREENVPLPRLWKQVVNAEDEVKRQLQSWIKESKLSSHMRFILRKDDL